MRIIKFNFKGFLNPLCRMYIATACIPCPNDETNTVAIMKGLVVSLQISIRW